MKQFVTNILQITHSQWIFRNISFHNRKNGYLQNKTADELLQHINSLSEVSPEELPESSRFLLEKKIWSFPNITWKPSGTVLDTGSRRGSQGKHSRASPRHASKAGLAEAQHQGTKPMESRDCSCQAPDLTERDASSGLLQQPSRHRPPSILTCHIHPAASSPSLGHCQLTVK